MNKKEIFKWAAILIVWMVGFTLMLGVGLEKQRKVDCIKWQEWTQEYPSFYLNQTQAIECEQLGIEVRAPIQKPAKQVEVVETNYREIFATVYAYNSEVGQTDADPYTMASGNQVYDGAIACPEFIVFGIKVEIKGKIYTCEDRMGEHYRDKNYFDIWMPTKEEANEWGEVGTQVKIYE